MSSNKRTIKKNAIPDEVDGIKYYKPDERGGFNYLLGKPDGTCNKPSVVSITHKKVDSRNSYNTNN